MNTNNVTLMLIFLTMLPFAILAIFDLYFKFTDIKKYLSGKLTEEERGHLLVDMQHFGYHPKLVQWCNSRLERKSDENNSADRM